MLNRFHFHKRLQRTSAAWESSPDAQGFTYDDCLEALERAPFFAKLCEEDREELAANGSIRRYSVGANLVSEGQRPGVGLYVVLRGRVRISHATEQGTVRVLSTPGPGEMFGELALVDDLPRTATVTAIEPTLALIIHIADFRAALGRNPEAALWLLQVFTERLRRAEATQP